MRIIDNISLKIPDDIGKQFLTRLMGGRLNSQFEKLLKEKTKICKENIEPKAIYDTFLIKKSRSKLSSF